MSKTKNQHYISQFYLERFGDFGKIDVYSLKDKKILLNQSPRNFAAKRYFYDIPKKEIKNYLNDIIKVCEFKNEKFPVEKLSDEQIVEHYLANTEGTVKKIFNDIECDQSILKMDSVKAYLSSFFHDLGYRTEKIRVDSEDFYKELYDNAKNIFPGHPEQCYKNFFPSKAKEEQLHKLLDFGPALETSLMLNIKYNWYVGINTSDKINFIISDNPAYLLIQGFNDICIPISKKYAIIFKTKNKSARTFTNDKYHKTRMYLTPKSVLIYNCFQVNTAHRYLFGNQNDIETMINLFNISNID